MDSGVVWEMPVWESFLDRLEGRCVLARIDVGYGAGDRIDFVFGNRRRLATIVRKEPCKPDGWVLLTVET